MAHQPKSRERQTMNAEQRDLIFFKQRDAERAANVAKTERLRALRLAKEAETRAAAEQVEREKAEKAAAKRAK